MIDGAPRARAEAALGPVVLEGRNVRLEPLRREHAEALVRAAQGDELWEWMSADLRRREAMDRWIDAVLAEQAQGFAYPFAVIWRADGRAIGSTRYMDVQASNRGAEIGWTWYAREFWGTVVNPEAKYLLLRHAFEEWGAIRVCLKTDAKNVRSQAAIEKLGARYEGTLRSHRTRRDGTIRDTIMFSIIRNEWPEVKTALEGRIASASPSVRPP